VVLIFIPSGPSGIEKGEIAEAMLLYLPLRRKYMLLLKLLFLKEYNPQCEKAKRKKRNLQC
jgi:hypothetical protein